MAEERESVDGYPGIAPLARPGPLRHLVEETLRDLIVSGALAPGQHLVEAEVAQRLQVSRGPVREAFQALHGQGWLDLKQDRGAFVHEPTMDEVDEVFGVRAVLEGEAALLAADRVTATDVDALREISARGRAAVLAGEYDTVVATNSELHRTIAELAGNRLLRQMIGSLDGRIRWYLRPVVRNRGESSWNEHDALVDALAIGDPVRARALMYEHTEQTRTANAQARTDDESQSFTR